MIITIASGKGGTGKTTISTNLAKSLASTGIKTGYYDCDAEEPNGHIFLNPNITQSLDVAVDVPQVDLQKCNGCGKCGQLCQYSAIICIKDEPMVFEQMCHSCGGCMAICPQKAIVEKPRKVGLIRLGDDGDLFFADGLLDIGAIQTPTMIKKIKKHIKKDAVNIIDAPPGTSCPVIEAVKASDFVLLVTEPTPFGLNDLILAVEMVRQLDIPFAVAINRADIGDDSVLKYCDKEKIEVILEINNDRKIAQSYSNGQMIIDAMPEYKDKFLQLYKKINEMVG